MHRAVLQAGDEEVYGRPPSPARYLWLIALLALPLLGWLGVLDTASSQQVDGSLSTAGLIYGTARGINALVSLLQGTEVSIPFLTVSVGEVLDPVNDLIERFSDIILIALASLALQKLLLVLVANTLFNVLLSIVAVATGLALFLEKPRLLSSLLKAFLLIAFFRFSLSIVVLANAWVDATFLDEADQQRHRAMEQFQGELRQVDTLSRRETEAARVALALEVELDSIERSRLTQKEAIALLDARIKAKSLEVEQASNIAGGLCGMSELSPTCPDAVKRKRLALTELKTKKENAADRLAQTNEAITAAGEKMECLEKQQRGESCGFWDSLPKAPDPAALRHKLNEINANMSDFAETCVNLLVSLLLKTVVIPLLFLYLLLKIMRINWARF